MSRSKALTLFFIFIPCSNPKSTSYHFSGVRVQTATEFAKALETFLEFFPNNKVLVDTLTGQVLLEQDGYSIVFASEGPPVLGCKGHGRNHPKSVKDAQASNLQPIASPPSFPLPLSSRTPHFSPSCFPEREKPVTKELRFSKKERSQS